MRRALTLVATAALILSLAGAANAASCKDDKGKFVKCPAAAAAPAAAKPAEKPTPKPTAKSGAMAATTAAKPASAMAAGGGPNCKTGKPCGNSCIAKDKVCHK